MIAQTLRVSEANLLGDSVGVTDEITIILSDEVAFQQSIALSYEEPHQEPDDVADAVANEPASCIASRPRMSVLAYLKDRFVSKKYCCHIQDV